MSRGRGRLVRGPARRRPAPANPSPRRSLYLSRRVYPEGKKSQGGRAAGLISAAESKAAAQAVRRLYRVRGGVDGVGGVRTPDIDAPVADVMEEGSAFFTKAEVRFLVLTGVVKGHGVLLASARAVVRILEAFAVPLFLYGFSRLRVVVGARCW